MLFFSLLVGIIYLFLVEWCVFILLFQRDFCYCFGKRPQIDMAKPASKVGFRSGQLGCGSNGLWVKMNHFKQDKKGFESIRLRVESVDSYFSHEFYKKNKNKENNMYLSFGKLSNKLLDVKCITFKIIQILTLLFKTK